MFKQSNFALLQMYYLHYLNVCVIVVHWLIEVAYSKTFVNHTLCNLHVILLLVFN